jgi:hypothetical protein
MRLSETEASASQRLVDEGERDPLRTGMMTQHSFCNHFGSELLRLYFQTCKLDMARFWQGNTKHEPLKAAPPLLSTGTPGAPQT